MQQAGEFTTLDGADLAADRPLTTDVLAAHLECERLRVSRLRLVHLVAALSGPLGLQVAFPGLLSLLTVRMFLAAWVGAAVWALATAGSEVRAFRGQAERLRTLRGRLGGNERGTAR